MAKRKSSKIHSPLESIVSSAPSDVLSTFLAHKMYEYIEPRREGTPKGEPVGLSRQKYHAAILSEMTGLDLKKLAKTVHVSYSLLLKWRTEEAFRAAGALAAKEFVDGDFHTAAKASLQLLAGHRPAFGPEWSTALVNKIQTEKLIGFNDGVLYSDKLLSLIHDTLLQEYKDFRECLRNVKPNEKPGGGTVDVALDYLSLTYCFDRISRNGRANLELQRSEASLLSATIKHALYVQPAHPILQSYAFVASLVLEAILKV